MKLSSFCLAICTFTLLFGSLPTSRGDGPLPEFTFQGVALHPKDLNYAPTNDLIHPTIIKTEGRIGNALGRYYLYHAPHKHVAISVDTAAAERNSFETANGPTAWTYAEGFVQEVQYTYCN